MQSRNIAHWAGLTEPDRHSSGEAHGIAAEGFRDQLEMGQTDFQASGIADQAVRAEFYGVVEVRHG